MAALLDMHAHADKMVACDKNTIHPICTLAVLKSKRQDAAWNSAPRKLEKTKTRPIANIYTNIRTRIHKRHKSNHCKAESGECSQYHEVSCEAAGRPTPGQSRGVPQEAGTGSDSA